MVIHLNDSLEIKAIEIVTPSNHSSKDMHPMLDHYTHLIKYSFIIVYGAVNGLV